MAGRTRGSKAEALRGSGRDSAKYDAGAGAGAGAKQCRESRVRRIEGKAAELGANTQKQCESGRLTRFGTKIAYGLKGEQHARTHAGHTHNSKRATAHRSSRRCHVRADEPRGTALRFWADRDHSVSAEAVRHAAKAHAHSLQ